MKAKKMKIKRYKVVVDKMELEFDDYSVKGALEKTLSIVSAEIKSISIKEVKNETKK
jgi:hypothetical protein